MTIGQHHLRVRRDEPPPARDRRPLLSFARLVDGAQAEAAAVDLLAEQRQDCRQQRVREQHRGQHAERAADPELGDEVEPDQRETGDRDRHRDAGEDDRASGGGARGGRRLLR